MRVLLINPPPYQRVDEYDTPNFTRLGLACLAAKLRADRRAEVEIIDGKFERLSYAAILERVRRFAPDVVGLTAFTNEIKPAAWLARAVKALSPRGCAYRCTFCANPNGRMVRTRSVDHVMAELEEIIGRGGSTSATSCSPPTASAPTACSRSARRRLVSPP